ncbi:MAG TPA: lysophospholipid acyltransferase family protein [Acidimicrobiia bacterium]|nr:lysophospholipid acyltransferase family protein [Acidimicrobiia bacterium]
MEPLYGLVEVLLRQPLRHGLRWGVEGVERIPADGPVLLASNHLSYFDPIAVAYLTDLAGRRVRFLAKAELFKNRILAAAFRSMGQIPVERGTGDASALDAAASALGTGRCVHVFPEGTISKDLDPMTGKTGLARLAKAAGVDVVPVGLWGTHRVIPAGGQTAKRFRTPITMVVGERVTVGPDANPRETTDRIMAGICAAVAHARRLYPPPADGDREAWWVRPPETARLRSCRGRLAQAQLDAEFEAPADEGRG